MPRVEKDVACAEGHHHDAHDQVGAGKGADEVVGDRLQTLKSYNGADDQYITKDDA